jgi:Carboxypeptidase regulatory-like domain
MKVLLILVCLFVILSAQTTFGQTIIKRFDWDANTSLGSPTVTVTQTPAGGTCTYTGANGSAAGIVPAQQNDGTAAGTVLPAGATYGVNSATDATLATAGIVNTASSNGYYTIGGVSTCTQPRRTVQVVFPAMAGTLFVPTTPVKISFRSIGLALDSATSGSGTDQTDFVRMDVSLDNGVIFSNEIGLGGNANTQTDYDPATTHSTTWTGANPSNINLGTTSNPRSRAELTIPAGTITNASQVVLRFTFQSNRGDEFVGLDDIIVSQLVPTAGQGVIRGRVTNDFGRGISRAAVSALNTNTGETFTGRTNPFGYYQINDLQIGDFFIVQAQSKLYQFPILQSFSLNENLDGINFTAASAESKQK